MKRAFETVVALAVTLGFITMVFAQSNTVKDSGKPPIPDGPFARAVIVPLKDARIRSTGYGVPTRKQSPAEGEESALVCVTFKPSDQWLFLKPLEDLALSENNVKPRNPTGIALELGDTPDAKGVSYFDNVSEIATKGAPMAFLFSFPKGANARLTLRYRGAAIDVERLTPEKWIEMRKTLIRKP